MPRPQPARNLHARGRRPLPPSTAGDLGFTLFVLAALAGIEIGARFTRADPEDAVALLALFLLFHLVRLRHRRRSLPWVEALEAAGRRVAAFLRRRTVILGVDLRGGPGAPAAFPPLPAAAALAGAVAVLALAASPGLDPLGVRGAVRPVSSLLWLLLLGGAWTLFLARGYDLLFFTFALTHDGMVRAHLGPGPRSRRAEFAAFLGWILAILGATALLPPRAALPILAACLAATALLLLAPGGPDVPLLWKRQEEGAPLRSVGWRAHVLAETATVGLPLAALLLLFHGAAASGRPDPGRLHAALPLTMFGARLFTWIGTAALAAWTIVVVRIALGSRFRNPARPAPPVVHVADRLDAGARRRVRESLRPGGLRARFLPARPRRIDVPITLGDPDPAAAFPAGEGGGGPAPIPVAPGDLASAETARRLIRRTQLLRRRLLVRGLERLFKKAAGRRFRQGTGFWVAPQHWFCIGLSRDEDERITDWKEGTFFMETVGPAYHRVFPRAVLHHFHETMAALEIDLLFVEDGVEFRRFRRVLRMAFEVHDMLGAKGRAEEIHFTGIPGVRVLIHEFDLEDPARRRLGAYPEPDYETVGRARILHVFRDRGEAEETVDAPRDRRGAPVLV